MALLDPLFGWKPVDDIFAEDVTVQRMLDFEAALARAEAEAGVIPEDAATLIAANCRAELFDLEDIAAGSAQAGNLAIPLIRELARKVAAKNERASGYVHWGATSQDVIDTALVLQIREALILIETAVIAARNRLGELALKHKESPIAGRTWMQHAVPIVLGIKFAGWAEALNRHVARMRETSARCFALQFGGAAGTLASLGDRGVVIAQALAGRLNLALPVVPWHTHRDRIAEVATVLGLLIGTLGKIGRDISLLSQSEVDEIREGSDEQRGGSSTMPQKRNPVSSAVLIAAATRAPGLVSTMLAAMIQEHERGLGVWHAEWDVMPELVRLAGGAVHQLDIAVEGLEIDRDRMRTNLDATFGLIFAEAVSVAVAEHTGRSRAHELIAASSREAVRTRQHLRTVLENNEELKQYLSTEELDRLFEPAAYAGSSATFIERVISSWSE
jgi:3-carboxy-cis,cis-muconate cycloisomerase